MAKTLDEILQEVDASFAPQRQAIQQRLDALPGQAEAQITGLKADQTSAFDEILGAARDRGMGFSGAPSAAQQKYVTDRFIPAVSNVRAAQENSRGSLFDALNNINLQKQQFGQGLYQQGLDRDEQSRQFNIQQEGARRAAAINPFAGLFGQPNQQQLPTNRPSLDDIFANYNPNVVPLGVNNSTGSTIPLGVAKPVPQQKLSVAKPRVQPGLRVR